MDEPVRVSGWRLFVAALLEPQANHELRGWVQIGQPLAQEHALSLRWVPMEQRHLTLQFLGDCEPEQVNVLAEQLSSALRQRTSVSYSWSGVETFGAPQRARVVFAGPRSEANELEALAARVQEPLRRLGYVPDKPFHGHVTLARLRPQRRTRPFLEAWNARLAMKGEAQGLHRFERIALMRSELNPDGARYHPLEQWTLRG